MDSLQGIFQTNIRNDIAVYRQTMDLVMQGRLKEAVTKAKNEFAVLDIQKAVLKIIKEMAAQAKTSKPSETDAQNLSA